MGNRVRAAAYAVGFTVVLPVALAAWAWLSPLGRGLPLPPAALGPPLTLAGLALWVGAVTTFVCGTGKLPLNADPPAGAVTGGLYALLADPIYVGFGLAVLGGAAWMQSSAGVWIVTPVTVLSMAALVAGYEGERRPVRARPPLLRWPPPSQPRRRDALNGLLAAAVVGTVLFAGARWPGPAAAGGIAVGLALFGLTAPRLHAAAVRLATRIANSWSAVRLGPARVINYAPIAALAAGGGVLAFSVVTPDPWATAVIAAAVLVGGGIWGKLLESTGRLARPFGYFGAFLGGVAGVVAVSLSRGAPLLALGAGLAIAATWIQAVGRLRCLVQGCCFGRPMTHGLGICYRRAESRAVALGGLRGRNLHPTPLFSIYANLLSAMLIARLYLAGQGAAAILAAYLLVAGLSRFAEEGFRGEADVRRYAGLTLYQWLSLGQLLAGIGFTLVASPPLGAPQALSLTNMAVAGLVALAFGAAMGVDFPDLDMPLARLTPNPSGRD